VPCWQVAAIWFLGGKMLRQNWRSGMVNHRKFLLTGLLISLFLAGVVSFYASSSPDGLEKVASEIGFIDKAKVHTNSESTLADYKVTGISNERASVGFAGVIGVIGTALVGGILFQLIARKSKVRK
jgi:cobalt/nickel transport protein